MSEANFNRGLLEFLQASPTPFHAVIQMEAQLQAAHFQRLEMVDPWSLQAGGRYYVKRNESSLIAFNIGMHNVVDTGMRMVGAHTDSPCLKVKPNPEIKRNGYLQLGVEVYGGVLLNPWFDRDLSLAGRVSFVGANGKLQSRLVDFKRAIAVIPSLAIHLDREVNEKRSVNAQRDIPPLLCMIGEGDKTRLLDLLRAQLQDEDKSLDVAQVLDYELCFYDTQPPAFVGLHNEFIASARLDNLASCYVGLQAILQASEDVTGLLVCNDHEEVGSQSASGAQGPLLMDVLTRIAPDLETRSRVLERSMMVSTDNAHGIHPNFPDKHDSNHGPLLNQGPVIKTNANQRYATNSETSALFKHLALQAKVPLQSFVSRSDMACGSTIGPLTASAIGVRTLDVGIPTFAMHSIRELAGSRDAYDLYQLLLRFHALDQLGF